MDEAAAGARDHLVNLSAADRLDVQRTVRDNPDLLPRLAAHLEEEAEKVAITPQSRGQVRAMVEHLNRALARPTAGAILDDYVARADRAVAEAGTVEQMTRRLEARLGTAAFASHQQRQEELARSWWEEPPPKDYPGAGQVYRIGQPHPEPDDRLKRVRRIRTGAILLGIGGEWSLLGAVLAPFTLGIGAVPLTAGFPMLIAGGCGAGSRPRSGPPAAVRARPAR